MTFATLLYEIAITRILSVTLWYYFGFLAISVAMMGTASAAVICFSLPREWLNKHEPVLYTLGASLFAITAPLAIAVHLRVDFLSTLPLQIVLFVLPFFSSGLIISLILMKWSASISRLYSVDLLGAALGSLLAVPILYRLSPLAVVFIVSAVACAAGSLLSREFHVPVAAEIFLVFAAVGLLLGITNDFWGPLMLTRVKSYGSSALQESEGGNIYEKWSPVSRIAVFNPGKLGDLEAMRVTNDGGAPTSLIHFDGDLSRLVRLKNDFRQIAHQLKRDARVLIIGSGGGMDVLAALAHRQELITAVEINPVIGRIVTREFADYIGNIFTKPNVHLHIQDGRNFAAGSKAAFDIVQITMIDSWVGAAAGAYVFNENSLYTKEALSDYVRRLTPGGFLSITRYLDWDEALRLVNMMIEQQNDSGIQDVQRRLIVVAEKPQPFRRATVLLKNDPYTEEECRLIQSRAPGDHYDMIYAPFLSAEAWDTTPAAMSIRSLLASSQAPEARRAFIARYKRNISAPTDNKPFFFFMDRLPSVFRPDPKDHPARRLAIPMLFVAFVSFFFLGLLTIFIPLIISRGRELKKITGKVPMLFYFACLGVGFMLVEISLIQRLTVVLGHPTLSFVVVLSALLLGSGLGSQISDWKASAAISRRLERVLALIIGLLLIYVFFIYDEFIKGMALSKPERIVVSALAVMIPGFFMGMCFPLGIKLIRMKDERLVPWAWGVNGAFSVFAAIFALILALSLGLKAVLAGGAISYAMALVLILGQAPAAQRGESS
jgi:spermidine synthase